MQLYRKILPIKDLFIAAGLPGYLLFLKNILLFFIKRRRDLDEYTAVDDSAFIQIIYISLVFFICLYIIFKDHRKSRFLFSTPQIFLFIYIGVCFVSMLWTPNIFLTGFRAFESLTYLILISIIAYNLFIKLHYQDIIEWCMLWIIWEVFWSLAIGVKFDGLGFLAWPFASVNLSLPMFFFFALLLTRRIYVKYIILVFAILMVKNATFFGIALGLFGFYFGNSRYKGLLFAGTFLVMVTLLFVNVEQLLLHTLFYGREEVSMASTSGRDKVWAIAWEAFLQKPFFGYGFVEGESRILYSKFAGAISTHSFLFSGLLGTGLLGTLFLIIYFFSVFLKAKSTFIPSGIRSAMVSTFIMSTVISLVSPGIGGRVYGSWIPVVLVFTIISSLEYKFSILNHYYNRQKIIKHENNLGNPFFSRLPNSGL